MGTDIKKKAESFFDEDGKLKSLPAKRTIRERVLFRLSESFEEGKAYTEKEINAVIRGGIAFSDVELIRRELCEAGLIGRLPDGSRYWKNRLTDGWEDIHDNSSQKRQHCECFYRQGGAGGCTD